MHGDIGCAVGLDVAFYNDFGGQQHGVDTDSDVAVYKSAVEGATGTSGHFEVFKTATADDAATLAVTVVGAGWGGGAAGGSGR